MIVFIGSFSFSGFYNQRVSYIVSDQQFVNYLAMFTKVMDILFSVFTHDIARNTHPWRSNLDV